MINNTKVHSKEWLEEAIKTKTVKEIKIECSCSPSLVRSCMKKFGIKNPKGKNENRFRYPQLADKEWLMVELKTKTTRQVAKEIGSTHGAVMFAKTKYGIEIPHRNAYKVTVDKSAIGKEAYAKRFSGGRCGSSAANWKGGRCKTGKGYIHIYTPEHPSADQRGYVMEHRLIAEKSIGRYLEPGEEVHHINGDKQDNREENLEVLTRGQHAQRHADAVKEVAELKARIAELESKQQL